MMVRRWAIPGLALVLYFSAAAPASAQVAEDLTVQTEIPQGYDRGRNISVTEQPRSDYSPLGVRFGSLVLLPRVEAGAGATSNTYLAGSGATASPFLYVRPSLRLVSDWAVHSLQLSGTATLRDYLGESARNERLWSLDAAGRLDLSRGWTVEAIGNASQAVENLFSGEVTSTVAALSRYRRDFVSLQTTYTRGRGRAFVLADYTDLRFRSVPLVGGGVRDQSDRDRQIARVTGQVEYAYSPSISLFAQVGGSGTRYDRAFLLTGAPNLDSRAVRFLAGVNVDIAGRIRGTIGAGYSIRNYDAATYRTVRGLSIESRIQLFPTRRLTVTVNGQRTIEDASLSRSSYWNSRVGVTGDYEVLRNLIVNATADYSHQKYLGSPLVGNIYRASLGGRYLGSRRVQLTGSVSYSRRSFSPAQQTGTVNEARVEAGIAYQL